MASDKKMPSIVTWWIIALFAAAAILPRFDSHVEDNTTQQATAQNVKIYTKAELQKMVADAEKRKQVAKEQAAAKAKTEAKKQKLLEYFKSGKEPAAKDALWMDNNWFYVGVWSDGSNRNGYAEYVCQAANDIGLKEQNIWVKIVDYKKVLQNEGFEELGSASCK